MFESKLNIYYTQLVYNVIYIISREKNILTIYWKSMKKGQI